VFVDLSIHVEPTWSVEQAHVLATEVDAFLRTRFDSVEDVVVHIEPDGHAPGG
jgi:divalent metal cation (Fe/Co/Zn/Cd) transporter